MSRKALSPTLPVLLGLVFVLSILSGCLGGGEDGGSDDVFTAEGDKVSLSGGDLAAKQAALADIHKAPFVLSVKPTVHVVLAGLPDEKFDEETVRSQLVNLTEPVVGARSGAIGLYHLPLRYEVSYEFHRAPDAFVQDFFTEARNRTTWAQPTAFLCAYDRDLGHDRLSDHPPSEVCRKGESSYDAGTIEGDFRDVRLIDATAMESWIAEHRAEYGLEFAKPSYTIFFLDGWTPGLLADEPYHYYHHAEDRSYVAGGQVTNMRAWGGNHDFLYLDYSAAPNNDLYDNSHQTWFITRLGFVWGYGTADTDPPIWDYGTGANARVQRTNSDQTVVDVDLNERMGRNVDSALQIRLLPTGFAYRPDYKPLYFVNFHHYQEAESIQPRDQMADRVDMPEIVKRLATQIPWAAFDYEYKSYILPDDDPGMQEAIVQSKRQGMGTYIHPQPIKDYVDANIERFEQEGDDIFNVKVMAFNFAGPYTIAYPAVVSGIGTSDAEGRPWGIIENVNDVELYAFDPGNGHEYNGLTSHEVGHFFGFHHPHDGWRVDQEGNYRSTVDWTWDQTATVMSYRVEPFGGDELDRDHIARGQAALNLNEALGNVRTAYEALLARGHATIPAEARGAIQATEDAVNTVIASFKGGLWTDAVVASIDALDLSRQAIDAAGGVTLEEVVLKQWQGTGLNHGSVEQGTLPGTTLTVPVVEERVGTPVDGMYSPSIVYDYEAIELDPSYDSVAIEVEWENSPSSFADLFAGWWMRDPAAIERSPVPSERHVNKTAAYDFVAEGPRDVGNVQRAVLDLRYADFWNFEELWAGAGTSKLALNGDYEVTITALKRTYP